MTSNRLLGKEQGLNYNWFCLRLSVDKIRSKFGQLNSVRLIWTDNLTLVSDCQSYNNVLALTLFITSIGIRVIQLGKNMLAKLSLLFEITWYPFNFSIEITWSQNKKKLLLERPHPALSREKLFGNKTGSEQVY